MKMTDLSTRYLGLALKNPVIAGSSGMTGSLDGIRNLEKHGVAAVVLKSIFEEEVTGKEGDSGSLADVARYIEDHLQENRLKEYLKLIESAKKELHIPVIGSINSISREDWTYFASRIENAGADALELNLLIHPADLENKSFEKAYFEIIQHVLSMIEIPVSIKISTYFTRLGLTIRALSETGVSGIVMFNRFLAPDIHIDTMELTSGSRFTTSSMQSETLRWIAIMSEKVECDLAASTGIHSGEDVIRMLLAGATVTQVVSTLYRNGPDQISRILKKLEKWMKEKEFTSLEQFRGRVSKTYGENPVAFERMQYIKLFGEDA